MLHLRDKSCMIAGTTLESRRYNQNVSVFPTSPANPQSRSIDPKSNKAARRSAFKKVNS
jgi:hypothetical protein